MEVLNRAGVPCGPIYDMQQVWDDPHVASREMRVDLEHPAAGTVPNIGLAAKLYGSPGSIRTAAPQLGQHTREVLADAGYSDAEIDRMFNDGVAA